MENNTLGINSRADLTIYKIRNGDEIPVPVFWVSSVKSGSAADQVGIQSGDIIVKMENIFLIPVSNSDTSATIRRKLTMENYCNILRTHVSSDQLSITVFRIADGQPTILEGRINGSPLGQK